VLRHSANIADIGIQNKKLKKYVHNIFNSITIYYGHTIAVTDFSL